MDYKFFRTFFCGSIVETDGREHSFSFGNNLPSNHQKAIQATDFAIENFH